MSWGAIFAGAAAAAALSLILLILGVGLGLSSVSPWSFEGVSKETFGWSSIAWLTFTALAASGLGGYLAGRLRTQVDADPRRRNLLPRHRARLRVVGGGHAADRGPADVGHRWRAGCGRKVAGATAGAAASTVGVAAAGASGAVAAAPEGDLDYWVDALFRSTTHAGPADPAAPPPGAPMDPDAAPPPAAGAGPRDAHGPAAATGAGQRSDRRSPRSACRSEPHHRQQPAGEGLDPADTQYLSQLIARDTGMSPAEAQARVTDVQTRMRAALEKARNTAKQAADDARKATAYAALWLFITLLIGAFFASLSATWGGRRRDL